MNQIIAQVHAFFKSISMFLAMTIGKQPTTRYRILHACLSDRAKHYRMHPYVLKEYRGRWYVLGHSDTREQIVILALDRMAKGGG
jgi:predicted DNA-binding transcriptional regulator YafY